MKRKKKKRKRKERRGGREDEKDVEDVDGSSPFFEKKNLKRYALGDYLKLQNSNNLVFFSFSFPSFPFLSFLFIDFTDFIIIILGVFPTEPLKKKHIY